MIFGTRTTQKVREGDLIKKFFIDFEKIKNEDGINVGWELIKRYFHED
jgi:hypothetical protein